MTANTKVSTAEYATIRSSIVNIMGSGSATQGYGQSIKSSPISTHSLVRQSDWDNLRFDIINARIHQTGAAFSAATNLSNSLDRTRLQFLNDNSTGFIILGMAVFGTGSNHPIVSPKFITAIQISGNNKIVTLNSATESVVNQGVSINFGPGSLSDFNEGTVISGSAADSYKTLAETAGNQRFLVANGQFLTDNAISISRIWSSQTVQQFWSQEISCDLTVTFSSSNEARWFFNSGGEVRIQSSRSSTDLLGTTIGLSNPQNNAWSSLLSSVGMISFGAQIPTAGFSPLDGRNFYRLTNAYQTYYSLSSSLPYSSNSYQLSVRSNVANNSAGTANIIYFRIRFIDGYVYSGPSASLGNSPDGVNGLFTVSVTEKRADGKLLPSGNFTITRPQYSISDISGS